MLSTLLPYFLLTITQSVEMTGLLLFAELLFFTINMEYLHIIETNFILLTIDYIFAGLMFVISYLVFFCKTKITILIKNQNNN